MSPGMWLSFQLDCDKWDPFVQIFRVSSLFSTMLTEKEDSISLPYPDRLDKELLQWTCIDEAQEDFRYPENNKHNMLYHALAGLWFTPRIFSDNVYYQQLLLGGTSLNISQALETVATFTGDCNYGFRWDDKAYRLVGNFPLAINETDAKNVLRACGLNSPRVRDMAAEYSRSLWGRVKWTAMFAESILKRLENKGVSNSEVISEQALEDLSLRSLADETYETVIVHLIDKLGIIHKRGGGTELLNKLLEATISADIRDTPHVFYQESDKELVEKGFATLDTNIGQLQGDLMKYFTILSSQANQLSAALTKPCDLEDGIIYLLTKAMKSQVTIAGCTINRLTPELANKGFTVVDYITTTMNDKEKQGFARAQEKEPTRHVALEKTLSPHGFGIIERGNNPFFVRLKQGRSLEENIVNELVKELTKKSLCITDMTFENLDKLVQGGFTVDMALVAELKERVVIDAIIRFSIGSRLEEKIIHSIKGISTRTGLGHPAEYYLAMVSFLISILFHSRVYFQGQ